MDCCWLCDNLWDCWEYGTSHQIIFPAYWYVRVIEWVTGWIR